MKKALKKINKEIYFYCNGVKKIIDRNDKSTYPAGLSGVISSRLYGEISSRLYGNISGFFGECTGVEGDIDNCEITSKEREAGININDLVN